MQLKDYEVMLLIFGAMAGVVWAIFALFVYNVAGDGIPAVVAYTILLPLAGAYMLGSWLHVPVDLFTLELGRGAALGVLGGSACTMLFRLRGI